MWIECKGENPADVENAGELIYYPDQVKLSCIYKKINCSRAFTKIMFFPPIHKNYVFFQIIYENFFSEQLQKFYFLG